MIVIGLAYANYRDIQIIFEVNININAYNLLDIFSFFILLFVWVIEFNEYDGFKCNLE